MANGFWNFFKKVNKIQRETKDKTSENYINNNPTEEQAKDNKNGNTSIVLSIISCILLIGFMALIVLLFSYHVAVGFVSILMLIIPAKLQNLAVKKIKKQLNINGKGKIKYLLVKYIFPTIAGILAVIILFCTISSVLK